MTTEVNESPQIQAIGLDFLFAEKNLTDSPLFNFGKMPEISESVLNSGAEAESVVNYYANELRTRHCYTVTVFTRYCVDSLYEAFFAEEKPVESAGFFDMMCRTAGFKKECHSLINGGYTSYELNTEILVLVAKSFVRSELEQIAECAVGLINQFADDAKKAYEYIRDDIEPKKRQINAIKEFLIAMNEGMDKSDPEKFRQLTKTGLDEAMYNPQNSGHSIFAEQALEKVGILPADKNFRANIYRILIYVDILSYAGYRPNFAEKVGDLKFEL